MDGAACLRWTVNDLHYNEHGRACAYAWSEHRWHWKRPGNDLLALSTVKFHLHLFGRHILANVLDWPASLDQTKDCRFDARYILDGSRHYFRLHYSVKCQEIGGRFNSRQPRQAFRNHHSMLLIKLFLFAHGFHDRKEATRGLLRPDKCGNWVTYINWHHIRRA